jgi:hypothetical protein
MTTLVGGIPYSDAQVEVATAIYARWTQPGSWGKLFAIASVANTDRETSLNPKAIGDQDRAYNIGQWWWSPRGADICAEIGLDVRDGLLATGLAAMDYEFSGPMNNVLRRILACTTVEDAAEAFDRYYEIAGAPDAIARSRTLATAWAQHFGV